MMKKIIILLICCVTGQVFGQGIEFFHGTFDEALEKAKQEEKLIFLDAFASWCGPCRQENPNVVALYKELHSKGLNIIGVSLDKDAKAWKDAIAKDKLTWNHVSNLKFWDEPIAAQYKVESIPATFILDASGNVVAQNLRGDELRAKILELLAK